MVKCPYCQSDMKKGFIEGDGRVGLIWVEENKKRSIISKIINSDCIQLDEANMLKTHIESNYCEICKKIIIDVK
ncbi:PF20097 family protein [Clostridium sp. JS66]|uniref:PF20097 family protein n=1 Tax=Clostridium sp. JS66 TaxID=3064705 RepID=UPI00298D658D|nr:PF20097 family protein [Clostridium sp. JS66]WPC43363.1 PF20097 family protein [Clostridium sp. JS66]